VALIGLTLDAGAAAWLEGLPSDRAEVHQATGMLIACHRIPANQALARLRAQAYATGRLVDDLARDLIAGRLPPSQL
jgi:AmiR/NasT family two-component response regulator